MNEPRTIGRLFLSRCQASGDDPAIGWVEKGSVQQTTYRAYRQTVEHLSLGLRKHGLAVGDRLCIIGGTCKEWHYLDLATLCARGGVIPIYPSYSADEMNYIIKHSESCVVAVENEVYAQKIASLGHKLPKMKFFVLFKPMHDAAIAALSALAPVVTIGELLAHGAEVAKTQPNGFVEMIQAQQGEEVASIIYTSGTTGEPKGALITQDAFTTMLENVRFSLTHAIGKGDRTLTFLPLSHVFGRAESFIGLVLGWEMVFAESLEKIIENLPVAQPTVMFSVPRVFEKLYAKVQAGVESAPPMKQKVFKWAMKVSNQYFEMLDRGEKPGFFTKSKRDIAYEFVLSKFYKLFGGRVRFFVSGGAPLSAAIMRFLRNANLLILEGYGLTETIAPACINPAERPLPGTVGKAIGEVEFKIAEDGEILIKSRAMFSEYYKNPGATAEAIKDGWFHSGDIGEFTPEGYLRITDRKKDIIVTSGGKNVAPQKIENMLKTQRRVSHAMVVGDRRNYLTVLIGVEREKFADELAALGLRPDCRVDELTAVARVRELVQADIDAVNAQLPKFETLKKFALIPEEITVDSGLITPSLKLKKKEIAKRYGKLIEDMYGSAEA